MPTAYKVFIDDDGSEDARKKTRKAFSPAALFPKDIPSIQVLSDFYDTASRLSHTSGLTFLRHIDKVTPTSEVRFSYQDIARENLPRELPIHLLTLCQTHLAILTAADIIFPEIETDLEAFRKERVDIFGRIMRFHATHKAQWGHKIRYRGLQRFRSVGFGCRVRVCASARHSRGIERHKTPAGGFNRETSAKWGVPKPPHSCELAVDSLLVKFIVEVANRPPI
jgi:hypothetical protein